MIVKSASTNMVKAAPEVKISEVQRVYITELRRVNKLAVAYWFYRLAIVVFQLDAPKIVQCGLQGLRGVGRAENHAKRLCLYVPDRSYKIQNNIDVASS